MSDPYRPQSSPPTRAWSLLALLVGALVVGCVVLAGYGAHRIQQRQLAQERLEAIARVERTEALAAELLADLDARFADVEPLGRAGEEVLRTYKNPVHLRHAQAHGIEPAADRDEAAQRLAQGDLVPLESNELYLVRSMRHGVPAVVQPAARALQEVGEAFQAELRAHGLPEYRFVISSATRSLEDQRRLQGSNVNAALRSSHTYGTTVDILYSQFDYDGGAIPVEIPPGDLHEDLLEQRLAEGAAALAERHRERLEGLLGRVLTELQDDGQLVVVYERQQPVFHTTVARS